MSSYNRVLEEVPGEMTAREPREDTVSHGGVRAHGSHGTLERLTPAPTDSETRWIKTTAC